MARSSSDELAVYLLTNLLELKLLEEVTTKDVKSFVSHRRALTHPPSWFSIPKSRASYAEIEGG